MARTGAAEADRLTTIRGAATGGGGGGGGGETDDPPGARKTRLPLGGGGGTGAIGRPIRIRGGGKLTGVEPASVNVAWFGVSVALAVPVATNPVPLAVGAGCVPHVELSLPFWTSVVTTVPTGTLANVAIPDELVSRLTEPMETVRLARGTGVEALVCTSTV